MDKIIQAKFKSITKIDYQIIIKAGLLNEFDNYLKPIIGTNQVVLVCDETVAGLYGYSFNEKLINSGYKVLYLTVKSGEESKTAAVKEYLELEMLKAKCDRHTVCIALGGGVIGDLVGYLAATYMRGIKFIQIPTTLLSMIDSSVGGKTGINTIYGKNQIGAFCQPQLVLMDLNLLNTLPKEQIINGIVEALKIFLTFNKKYFFKLVEYLPKLVDGNYTKLGKFIAYAVKLKVMVVKKDEKEQNLRMVLNFGHTIGHSIEKLSQYKMLHGYCVGLGILVEAKIANNLKYLSDEDFQIISYAFDLLDINAKLLASFAKFDVIDGCRNDKKNKDGLVFFILLKQIGEFVINNGAVAIAVDAKDINQALDDLIGRV